MEYSELIKDYLDDAQVHLKAFDTALMLLEQDGHNREVVVSALGALHTLKGNSGMMGYESMKGYIHQVEEVMKKIDDSPVELDRLLEILFDSANVIRNALQSIGNDPQCNPELTGKISELEASLESPEGGTEKQSVDLSTYLGTKTNTIKVDFKRLDDLLNLVGELVIFKTRLNQIETQIRAETNNKPLTREFNEGLELMGKTITGLQEGIMRVRMLPVRQVFQKFPRMVRDLSKRQGKEINLVFEGEDTELDKTVIDELEEPLLHILRNAVDHGIETPKVRVANGKERQGKIILSAAQESNYVIIRVQDDGKGINAEKIREAAVAKGLLQKGEELSDADILSLIFSAGFSTMQEATDISGRGIGLDIVSKNMSKLNGQVLVESIPEKGSAFVIKLPLSLAIIPALMAETGGEVYAIPMSAVDESIKVREEDLHVINNREVIRFRDRVIPVIRLDEYFSLKGRRNKRFYLVIIGRAEKRLAIAVDRLRGQQEIVIKALDDTFGKSYGIAGASILGNGRIVLILDVMALWNKRVVHAE